MKSLVVANWKMNPATLKDAKKLFEATQKALAGLAGPSVVVAPPAVFLRDIAALQRGGKIGIAAQNVHYEAGGAFTGETSVAQARDAKAAYALVGHAERRAMGETDADTGKKVAALIDAKMTPILCVGEKERGPGGEHFSIIKEQLRAGLSGVPAGKIGKVLIAYEPVWAIGAPQPMQPRDMHEMSIFIRKSLVERFGAPGMSARVLYGGALDAASAPIMMREGDVKGLLVGRASLDGTAFAALLAAIARA